jgi:hypothetical protein
MYVRNTFLLEKMEEERGVCGGGCRRRRRRRQMCSNNSHRGYTPVLARHRRRFQVVTCQ